MSHDPGSESASTPDGDFLSTHQIDRLVAGVYGGHAGDEGGRAGKFTLMVLCFVCLVVGASARDIAHWAMGDFPNEPFGYERTGHHDRFRCGLGDPLGPAERPVRENRMNPAATDSAPALPTPAR